MSGGGKDEEGKGGERRIRVWAVKKSRSSEEEGESKSIVCRKGKVTREKRAPRSKRALVRFFFCYNRMMEEMG